MANEKKQSGLDALANSYRKALSNQKPQEYEASGRTARTPSAFSQNVTIAPRMNVMDMAINSLRNRVANSSVGRSMGEWAKNAAETYTNHKQIKDWLRNTPEGQKYLTDYNKSEEERQKAEEIKRQQDAITLAQDIDVASSLYEPPTKRERVKASDINMDNADMFSNDWEPVASDEYETWRTVQNERYNPLSREERDELISSYYKAKMGGADSETYHQIMVDVARNGGIQQLVAEQKADADNDRDYFAKLNYGINLDDMNTLQRTGRTFANLISGTEKQWLGQQMAGIETMITPPEAMSAKAQTETFQADRDKVRDAAWDYVSALVGRRLGGVNEQEVSAARNALNSTVMGDYYLADETYDPNLEMGDPRNAAWLRVADQLNAVADRIAEGDSSITKDNILDFIQGGNLSEQVEKAFNDDQFQAAYENLLRGGAEDLELAKAYNPIAGGFGDMVIDAASSSLSSAQSVLLSRMLLGGAISGVSNLQTRVVDKLAKSGAAKFLVNGAGFVGNRIQDILGMAAFGTGAYGASANEARQKMLEQGIDIGLEEARKIKQYAAANTGIEFGSEMLFSSIGAIKNASGSSIFNGFADEFGEALSGFVSTPRGKAVVGTIGKLIGGGIEEGLEEVIGDFVRDVCDVGGLVGDENKTTFEEYLKDFLVGAMSGLMGEVTSTVYAPLQRENIGKQVKAGEATLSDGTKLTVQDMVNLANSEGMEGTTLAKTYNDLFKGLPRSIDSFTNKEVGRLYEAYEETLGKSEEAINRVQDTLDKFESGEELRRSDINKITNNADAVRYLQSAAGTELNLDGSITERKAAVEDALRAFASQNETLREALTENVSPDAENANMGDLEARINALPIMNRQAMPNEIASGYFQDSTRDTVRNAAQQMGIGEEGQNIMAGLYSGNRENAIDYVGEMTKYYNQGKENKELNFEEIAGNNLANDQQSLAAWRAGRADYLADTARREINNEGTEGQAVLLRDGTERMDGENSVRESAAMGEVAGGAEVGQTGFQQRSAGAERVYSGSKVGARLTESQLNARDIAAAGYNVVTGNNDAEANNIKNYVTTRAAKNGIKVRDVILFRGAMLDVNGAKERGFFIYHPDGSVTIAAQLDNEDATGEQIATHEFTHALIKKNSVELGNDVLGDLSESGEKSFGTIRDYMAKELGGQDKLVQAVNAYAAVYKAAGAISADANGNISKADLQMVFEEMICDFVAGMNAFAEVGHVSTAVRSAPVMAAAKKSVEQMANGTRGSPSAGAYLPRTQSEQRSRYDGSSEMYAIDPNGRKYSLGSLKSDIFDNKFQNDLISKLGWTQNQVKALVASLNDLMEYIKPNRDILDLNETYTKENRPYSPYKPNSDPLYKISLDYSTLCRKRLMTQYIIEKLQLREHRPMSGEEQIAIRDMLKEYRQIESGLQVACAMCYVEAARLKSPDQMNRYFEDPTPVLKNFFAQKNKAYKRKVENLQKKWKTDHGYDANATKKEMTPADVSAFNEYSSKIRHDYDPATDQADAKRRKEELAAIERAKNLSPDNYLSAENLANLKEQDPLVYDAYTSNIRAATRSKGLETDVPYYYGDSRRKGGPSDKFIKSVNAENGMRFSSWSDFQFTHLLDQMMATIDLSVRKAAMHGYTKFPEQVRIFGRTGAMFNMSGVSGGTGFNADGSLYFSPTESIDFEEAKRLRDQFPDTAGLQCIGINDKHVKALLASDYIDYVIPYHVSGMNAALRNMAKISSWKDYTSTQEESVIDSKAKWEDSDRKCPKDKWHKGPVFSEFFDPAWYTDPAYKGKGVEAMREAAKRYVQMCADRGMRPKFTQFLTEANYWKLLIDRKMVNQKTGDLIQQRPVTPDFDFDVIKKEIADYVAKTRKEQGIEDRALEYISDHWDELPGRIAALKAEGAVEKNIARAEEIERIEHQANVLGSEMYVAAPKNVAAYKYSRDLPSASNFDSLYTTLEDGRIKPNNVEDLSTEDWKLIYKAVNKLGYGLESAKQAKEVYSRYVGQGGFNKEQSEAIKKAYGVTADGGVAANPKREALARKTFGTTGDFREAGYLMRNGSMLDFSGKKDGGPSHVRYMDHREIGSVFGENEIPEDKRRYGDNSAYMNAFISEGNIRLMDGQGVTIGEMEPTAQQYTMLKQFIDRVMRNEDYFYLDLSNNDGYTVASRDYEGRDGSAKVIRDIKEYFKNGELPYRSSLSQFYSRDLPANADETAHKVVENLRNKAKLNDLAAKYGSFKSTAYTDERIAQEIEYSYATGERSKDYAKAYIAFVNPKDFVDATSTWLWRGNLYQEVEDKAKEEGRESMLDLDALQNERQSMFLRIEATEDGRASIVGHEGRHRMIGLEKEGYKYVPVIIEPREGSYPDGQSRYSTKPIDMLWLNGQEFGSGNGTSFVLHDILPLSANYADIAKEIFAGGKNVTKFSRDLSNTELYEANRQLQKDVTELRQQLKTKTEQYKYWKGQTKTTEGRQLRIEDVTKLAREIIKGQESSADAKAVAEKMKALGEYLLNSQDENVYDEARLKAYEVAHDILANAKTLNTNGGDDFYSDFRTALKNQPIYVAPSVREEVAPDGWNEFRKAQYGTVNMTADQSKGKSVDKVYHDLQATFGEWLLPEYITSEADQLNKILEIIETYRPVYENLNSYEMADAVEWTANEILTRIIGNEIRETNPTYADRMEKKLADQKAKAQTALKQVRQQRDRKVADLKEHYQQVAEDRRNRKIDSEMRTRLLKIAKRLNNKKLDRVTRGLLDQYIGELDLVSKGILDRTIKDIEHLRDWYDAYKDKMGEDFVPDISIENRIKRLSQKHINDLTQEEVADLTTVLLNIETMLRTKDKLLESQIKSDVYAAGMQTIDDIANSNGKTGFLAEYIGAETASPERYIHRITGYRENSPLYQAAKELSDGQRKMLDYQRRAEALFKKWTTDKKFIRSIAGKHAEAITARGYVDGAEKELNITPAMAMSLYLHAKNDDNMRHISQGGVMIPNMELYLKGKLPEAYAKGERVVFTRSMIAKITAQLDEKEKAFADAVGRYYNTMSRDEINDVSEILKGFAIAGVENYFPIDTNGNFLAKTFDTIKRDGSIEGMGFLKERIDNASTPIMLYDLNTILNRSISQHSKYVGLAIPVRNFEKLYNVTTFTDNGVDFKANPLDPGWRYDTSIATTLEKNWGKAATSYVAKMMADIENGTGLKDDKWGDLLAQARSKYAGAVLTTNASVAMKQAASYPTAAAVVGYKALGKALADFRKYGDKTVDMDKLAEYTPLYWYRSKGFSTTELGDIGKEGGHIPKALNWIQGIDMLTTRKLAKAAMYYVADNSKDLVKGTDAWWKEVARVYNRIIEETQPNYTMMQRPQILRSDNALTRALQMFKTQPFQNFNILYDAFGNLAAKSREYKANATDENLQALKSARANAARAVSSQAVSAIVFALMQWAWDAFRGKVKKYRDDDDEKDLLSWLKGIGLNVASSVGGMIPFGSYALELGEAMFDAILKGFNADPFFDQTFYGMSENASESLNDMGNALLNIVSKTSKTLEAGELTESSVRSLADSVEDIAQFAGVPVKNVVNLMQAIARNVILVAEEDDFMARYKALRITTDPAKYKSDYYSLLEKAYRYSDSSYGKLYNALISDKDVITGKESFATESNDAKANIDASVKKWGYALLEDAWKNDRDSFEELREKMLNLPGDPFATSSKTAAENIDAKVKEWKKEETESDSVYQDALDLLKMSDTWQNATEKEKKAAENNLLNIAAGTNEDLAADAAEAKAAGMDETEYVLFKIALSMADKDKSGGVSNKELLDVINEGNYTDEQKAVLWKTSSGIDPERVETVVSGGKSVGLTETEYMLYRMALPMFDTDGNGSYTKAEVEAAIRSMRSLTNAEKAYLFSVQYPKTKTNPFK